MENVYSIKKNSNKPLEIDAQQRVSVQATVKHRQLILFKSGCYFCWAQLSFFITRVIFSGNRKYDLTIDVCFTVCPLLCFRTQTICHFKRLGPISLNFRFGLNRPFKQRSHRNREALQGVFVREEFVWI